MNKTEGMLIEEYYDMGWTHKEVLEGIEMWHFGREEAYKYLSKRLIDKIDKVKSDDAFKGVITQGYPKYLDQ